MIPELKLKAALTPEQWDEAKAALSEISYRREPLDELGAQRLSARGIIMICIVWGASPQGTDYWNRLYSSIPGEQA